MTPETLLLEANDWVPNNSRLPVLHYRQAMPESAGASDMEALFETNGWPPQWRYGIFDFHHYHTLGHEALGIVGGSAEVMLGGPGGHALTLALGDVVVLPAGIGHCCLQASHDFLVVGAYPPDQQADLCRQAPSSTMQEKIVTLPFPESDPVNGGQPSLTHHWPAAAGRQHGGGR